MSLHTIVPMEALEETPSLPQAVCLPRRYGFVSGTRNEEGRLVISQLISTDPAAYLDPKFSPGALFEEDLPPKPLG